MKQECPEGSDGKTAELTLELIASCIRTSFEARATAGCSRDSRKFRDWWNSVVRRAAPITESHESEQPSLESLYQSASIDWWKILHELGELAASRSGVDGAVIVSKVERDATRFMSVKREIPGIRWIRRTVQCRIIDELNRTRHHHSDFLQSEIVAPATEDGRCLSHLFAWLAESPHRVRALVEKVDIGKSPNGRLDLLFCVRWTILQQFRGGSDLAVFGNDIPVEYGSLGKLLEGGGIEWAEWWIPWSAEESEAIFISRLALGRVWNEVRDIYAKEGRAILLTTVCRRLSILSDEEVPPNSVSKRLSRLREVVVKSLGTDDATELLDPQAAIAAYLRRLDNNDASRWE